MSFEEDLASIRLKERLISEASKPDAPPSLAFRLKMIETTRIMEKESEIERTNRNLRRQGRVDIVELPRETDEYFQELHKVTEPDEFWRLPEATYNVLEHRARPPPPKQASLWY